MTEAHPRAGIRRWSLNCLLLLLVTAASAPVLAWTDEPESRTDALGDPLPDGARLRLGTLRFRHPTNVDELALSPDERSVVTLERGLLIVWDTETGKERWRADAAKENIGVVGASYGIRALVFAADSARFFTTDGQNKIVVWETDTGRSETIEIQGKQAGLFVAVGGRTKAIDVTRDGKTFAVGGPQSVVVCDSSGEIQFEIANKAAGKPVDVVEMNQDRLMFGGHYSFCRFSPDENTLAVVTDEEPKVIRLLHAKTGKEMRRILLADRMVRLAFTPDSQRIVATERDVAVRMYSVETAQKIWEHKIVPKTTAESYLSAVAISPDGSVIAACAPIGSDYAIRLLDPETGEETGKLVGHTWKPWAVAFTADSQMLYSSGWDGTIRRWNVPARKQLPLPVGVRGTGTVAAAPDGRTLTYSDDSGTIRLVDAENGTELRTFDLPGTAYEALTFSPDGRHLAGGGTHGDDVHVAVWEVKSGQLVHRWDWPKGRDPYSGVECLKFSPDGKRLAAAVFRQDMAYLWDLATGQQIAQLRHDEIYGLSFSPDGKTLATAGWDKKVRFWNGRTGDLLRQFEVVDQHGQDLRMYTVCYSPESPLMATAHLDGLVRIWNTKDMTLRNWFQVSGRFIYGSICFSQDGSWLATGSASGSVAIWEPRLSKQLCEAGKHQSHIYQVCWPKDDLLLSGGSDGVAYAWDLRCEDGNDEAENDTEQLWKDLSGDDERVAFRAMCALAAIPERAVALLAQKIDPGASDTDAMLQTRAVSLLGRLGTPRARLLLRGWASAKPDSTLARMAAEVNRE